MTRSRDHAKAAEVVGALKIRKVLDAGMGGLGAELFVNSELAEGAQNI